MIVNDDLIFNAEHDVDLPIAPCIGLQLYNSEWRPAGFDESEVRIKEVAYDLKTGSLICYLPCDDFRYEASGCSDWTEKEVREYFRHWALNASRRTRWLREHLQ